MEWKSERVDHRVSKILQTSFKVSRETCNDKIFYTPEIKELLETLDKKASEIYKWKKAGKKLLKKIENPEKAA